MESDSKSVRMDRFPRKEKVPGGETEEMEVEVEFPSLVRPAKRERESEAEECSSGPPPKKKMSGQGREIQQGQNSRPVLMDRTRTSHLICLSDSGSMDSERLRTDPLPRKEKVQGGETEEMEVEVEVPSLVRPDKREREPREF